MSPRALNHEERDAQLGEQQAATRRATTLAFLEAIAQRHDFERAVRALSALHTTTEDTTDDGTRHD